LRNPKRGGNGSRLGNWNVMKGEKKALKTLEEETPSRSVSKWRGGSHEGLGGDNSLTEEPKRLHEKGNCKLVPTLIHKTSRKGI